VPGKGLANRQNVERESAACTVWIRLSILAATHCFAIQAGPRGGSARGATGGGTTSPNLRSAVVKHPRWVNSVDSPNRLGCSVRVDGFTDSATSMMDLAELGGDLGHQPEKRVPGRHRSRRSGCCRRTSEFWAGRSGERYRSQRTPPVRARRSACCPVCGTAPDPCSPAPVLYFVMLAIVWRPLGRSWSEVRGVGAGSRVRATRHPWRAVPSPSRLCRMRGSRSWRRRAARPIEADGALIHDSYTERSCSLLSA
jgi:hypothetical protein